MFCMCDAPTNLAAGQCRSAAAARSSRRQPGQSRQLHVCLNRTPPQHQELALLGQPPPANSAEAATGGTAVTRDYFTAVKPSGPWRHVRFGVPRALEARATETDHEMCKRVSSHDLSGRNSFDSYATQCECHRGGSAAPAPRRPLAHSAGPAYSL